MKRQISRLMVIVGVACFCVGTVSAEEAIKLKTSKEISGSIFGTQVHFVQSWKYKEVLPLIENGLVPGQNCWFYGNRETGFYQYFHHFFA